MMRRRLISILVLLSVLSGGIGRAYSQEDRKLAVIQVGENELHIYSPLSDGNTLLLKFAKKEWGTWNIEGWFLALDGVIPSARQQLMAGGGTDWEYEFRVAGAPGEVGVFSGGNHGNERLKEISLVDPANGDELNLKPDEILMTDSLKIIEDTWLIYDEDIDCKYAEVRRTYDVSAAKILLSYKVRFLKDIYMGTSYVSMFPTTKEYGRYALFEDTGDLISTPEPGRTETDEQFENFLGMENTLSVIIWGDRNPSYMFRSWIGSRDMADGFSNALKVFYWDVNRYGNKLYFSKFDNNAYTRVEAGTIWDNRQGWELLFD